MLDVVIRLAYYNTIKYNFNFNTQAILIMSHRYGKK